MEDKTQELKDFSQESIEKEKATGEGKGNTSSGLEPNILAGISYVLAPTTSLIVLLLEKENRFVRFHAAQGLVVFGGWLLLNLATLAIITVLLIIPVVNFLASLLLILWIILSPLSGLVLFILWIILLIKAFSGEYYKVPVLYRYAEKLAGFEVGG